MREEAEVAIQDDVALLSGVRFPVADGGKSIQVTVRPGSIFAMSS